MLLAAFAVVLGVCAVLGGLAVWKVYQQRQVCLRIPWPSQAIQQSALTMVSLTCLTEHP